MTRRQINFSMHGIHGREAIDSIQKNWKKNRSVQTSKEILWSFAKYIYGEGAIDRFQVSAWGGGSYRHTEMNGRQSEFFSGMKTFKKQLRREGAKTISEKKNVFCRKVFTRQGKILFFCVWRLRCEANDKLKNIRCPFGSAIVSFRGGAAIGIPIKMFVVWRYDILKRVLWW